MTDLHGSNYLWRSRAERVSLPHRDWRTVTQEVAQRHGLTFEEITGPSVKRRCAWPRQEAWALIWAQGRLSLPEIGRRFDRGHDTVLRGVRQYERRLAS